MRQCRLTRSRASRASSAHCNGEWEHHQGISIESCDNPGWWVKIHPRNTNAAGRLFEPILQNIGDDGHVLCDPRMDGHTPMPRWLHCHIDSGVWNGVGDETRLAAILTIFPDWAEDVAASLPAPAYAATNPSTPGSRP